MHFDPETILTAFTLVFLAELGDKTQLVAFSMTSGGRSPWTVFFGASSALVVSALLAALVGDVAASGIPGITAWLSAGLFLGFGAWILLVDENPPVKQAFLDALLLEKTAVALLTRGMRHHGINDAPLRELIDEEAGHARLFRLLLRRKRLFADDINRDPALAEAIAGLTHPPRLGRKTPFVRILEETRRIDQAGLRFYRFLARHLDEEHHRGDELCETLATIIRDEERHLALLDARLATLGSLP